MWQKQKAEVLDEDEYMIFENRCPKNEWKKVLNWQQSQKENSQLKTWEANIDRTLEITAFHGINVKGLPSEDKTISYSYQYEMRIFTLKFTQQIK